MYTLKMTARRSKNVAAQLGLFDLNIDLLVNYICIILDGYTIC